MVLGLAGDACLDSAYRIFNQAVHLTASINRRYLKTKVNSGLLGYVGQLPELYPSGNPDLPAIRQIQRRGWCPKTITTSVGLQIMLQAVRFTHLL